MTTFLNLIWNGKLDMSTIDHTHITLIPKVPNLQEIKNFGPINLCNVSYKSLSKAVVLQLKTVHNSLISFNQSAFIPGRLITGNVLIAHEIFHSIKSRYTGKKSYMALKLDMEKAYD